MISQENLIEALEKFDEALRLFRQILRSDKHILIADTFDKKAIVFTQQGEFILALKHHFRSLQILRYLKEASSIAQTKGNIGIIFANLEQYDLALINFNEALRIDSSIIVSDKHSSKA